MPSEHVLVPYLAGIGSHLLLGSHELDPTFLSQEVGVCDDVPQVGFLLDFAYLALGLLPLGIRKSNRLQTNQLAQEIAFPRKWHIRQKQPSCRLFDTQ